MSEIVEINTQNDLRYHFFPVSSDSIQFRVQLPNDAHIALTYRPIDAPPIFEIFIGGWRNTKCAIRKHKQKSLQTDKAEPGIVSAEEYRGFWISWHNGVISAGRSGNVKPFISRMESELFPVKFVGVCTGWGASGSWQIEVSPVIYKSIKQRQFQDGKLHWMPMTCHQNLPPDALIVGFECEPTYVTRAVFDNGTVSFGRYFASKRKMILPYDEEIDCSELSFQILCGYNAVWVNANFGNVPENPFVAGIEEHSRAVHIGRTFIDGKLITGKVYASHVECYFRYNGRQMKQSQYEILVSGDVVQRDTTVIKGLLERF